MGALCIRISDAKNKKVLVDGVENVDSAELLLSPIIRGFYEKWRREPDQEGHSTIGTMYIEYLGVQYAFLDYYWD